VSSNTLRAEKNQWIMALIDHLNHTKRQPSMASWATLSQRLAPQWNIQFHKFLIQTRDKEPFRNYHSAQFFFDYWRPRVAGYSLKLARFYKTNRIALV